MLSQSLFSFLSLLCTLSHAAPAAFPVAKRSTASRGLLYAPGPALSAFHGKVSWSVNWATAPSAGSTDLGEYVAQLWGTDANRTFHSLCRGR